MNDSDTDLDQSDTQAEKQALTQTVTQADNIEKHSENSAENQPEFFPVSEGKLITLYILSFGLYGIYWFYKNWKLQQPKMDKKILPVMRAIFSIFFTHSLFNRINKSAEHLEEKHKFNANLLATLFVAAIIIGNILDRVTMSTGILEGLSSNTVIISSLIIFMISVYPMAVVQATVNRINNDMLGYLNHKYSVWNYLLIALGVIAWLMLAMGLLAESLGLVPPE
jgi:hypothetical protein